MRALTQDEQAVLGDGIIDPAGWWAHVQGVMPAQAESAVAAKVAQLRPAYDAAKGDPDYKPRGARPVETPSPLEIWSAAMARSELEMPPALEDVLEALIAKGGFALGQATLDALAAKKALRTSKPA